MSLRLSGVSLSYGDMQVIRDLSLDVESGEMLALLGASGCGKTTVLKIIAGLLTPNRGTIQIDGADMRGVPTESRRAAVVFQKPLLFPYLSVAENVGFSLKLRGANDATIRERVGGALELVRLAGYESRRPGELSGGQEQRVSLARALVSDPAVLLLDEPFAALDENLRAEIRSLVRTIQRTLKLTAVFVTHDQVEAAAVAHCIAFLHDGRVQQSGSLRDFYERPESLAAARFFGWQLIDDESQWIAIRPETIQIEAGGRPATVESSTDLGTVVVTRVRLQPSKDRLELKHGPPEFVPGQAVHLRFPEEAALRFPKS